MWREACAMLLVGLTLQAQGQTPEPEQKGPKGDPSYEIRRTYTQLRRGTSEDVGVVLLVPGGWVATSADGMTGITPAKLELEGLPGLTVSGLRYPKPPKINLAQTPNRFAGTSYFPITLKLSAAPDVQLGEETLRGKITYQIVTKQGPSETSEMEILFPVTVVDRHAKVEKEAWGYRKTPTGEVVLLAIVGIAFLPILIPLGIACTTVLHNCD